MPVVAADASDADELAAHMQEVKALLQSNPSIVPSVLQYAKRMVAKSKKICVRKLSGEEVVTLHVKAKDTVKSVKDKVASVLKLDPRETKLTLACGATQLRDEKDTMHACRIQNDAVLTAILQKMPEVPEAHYCMYFKHPKKKCKNGDHCTWYHGSKHPTRYAVVQERRNRNAGHNQVWNVDMPAQV